MSVKNRVTITKALPGANLSDTASSTSGLIIGGTAVAGKLVLGTSYKVTNAAQLADLGITPAYDTANATLVHYHCSEFFRMAGDGVTLWLMVVANSILPGAMLDDTGSVYAKKLVIDSSREIRQLAIAFIPVAEYTIGETLTDGMNSDIRIAVPKAQVFAEWAYVNNCPLQVILDGRKASPSTLIDLRSIVISGDTMSYDKVSVVIGQDFDFASALAQAYLKTHSAVGTALGTLAGIDIEKNIGEVETLNLTNVLKGRMVNGGLSNNTSLLANDNTLDTLDDKGYIFTIKYPGVSGLRWNDDHVACPVIIDSEGVMNEHTIAFGRVMGESKRELNAALVPKVKTTHLVDENTGKLGQGTIKFFEGIGNDVFDRMKNSGHITAGDTIVDPNSDLFHAPKQLNVSFVVVPKGTIGKIAGTIFLKTNF